MVHGRNVNECVNNTIWQKYPKRVYVGFHTMEIDVASVIISFNGGGLCLLPVFNSPCLINVKLNVDSSE